MENNNFMRVEDVAKELCISKSYAYKDRAKAQRRVSGKRIFDHLWPNQPQVFLREVLLRRG